MHSLQEVRIEKFRRLRKKAGRCFGRVVFEICVRGFFLLLEVLASG